MIVDLPEGTSVEVFDLVLVTRLRARRDDLRRQIAALTKDEREMEQGMQEFCVHAQITTGTYTFGGDSYSQTWCEGPTYKCEDCGLYERGYDGVLAKVHRRSR